MNRWIDLREIDEVISNDKSLPDCADKCKILHGILEKNGIVDPEDQFKIICKYKAPSRGRELIDLSLAQ